MICVIALIVFGILGIFSASHRKLAKKAFDCVFRRITLRPCQSGLDRHLKSQILGFLAKSPKIARFVAKYFELLSWIFTILLFVSFFFAARGIYFLVVYGNCNGIQGGFCIYDALHSNSCSIALEENTIFKTPSIDDDPFLGNENASVVIIEFGCYSCPYTLKAEPIVKKIIKNYGDKIKFVYRDFLIPSHNGSELRAMAAECAKEQNKYWEYHDSLFENHDKIRDFGTLVNIATELNMNIKDFTECLESERYKEEVIKDFEDGKSAGVYGTPTFFINNRTIVGNKPYEYFKKIIEEELKWQK